MEMEIIEKKIKTIEEKAEIIDFFVTSLHNLKLSVHLGITSEERKTLQEIRITFKLYQPTNSEFCNDDNSKKYTCYATLAAKIKEYCNNKEFKLLEYLCFQIYKLINSNIPKSTHAYVMVEKLDPKIPGSECIAKCDYGYSEKTNNCT